MKFSREREIKNNTFVSKISFKEFGGDGVYSAEDEARLIDDFGYPSIEIGLIMGTYSEEVKNGKKEISVVPETLTVNAYHFDEEPDLSSVGEDTLKVCAHLRGCKKLDSKFSVTCKLPITNAEGESCAMSHLPSEDLTKYEAKCRLFEETLIARIKLALEDLYAKDTVFEVGNEEELIVQVNETSPVPEIQDPHKNEDVFIG